MNTKLIMAVTTLFMGSVSLADDMPAICKNLAQYTAQITELRFTEAAYGDVYNPKTLKLNSDFKKYQISKVTDLGNCEEEIPGAEPLKDSWCRVAGGSPEIYRAEVSVVDSSGGSYPAVDVIVNYNRGGCTVREVVTK